MTLPPLPPLPDEDDGQDGLIKRALVAYAKEYGAAVRAATIEECAKVCDSYAAENQRISDERDRLRELLRECKEVLSATAHGDPVPGSLRDRIDAALKEGK